MATINSVGLGTWGLGGKAYGKVTSKNATDTILASMSANIQVFDTANIYGDGVAEEILGSTIPYNYNHIIITKVGYQKEFCYSQDFSKKAILESVSASLRRLKREYIDILLLHSPDVSILKNKGVINTLESLKSNNIIGKIGVSVRNIDSIEHLLKWEACSVVECVFNLLDQRLLDSGLLELCHERKIDVIAKTPLCFGILTGKYNCNHVFQDHRSRWDKSQINKWIKGAKLFSFLETKNRSLTQSAIAFCISQPGITWTIPGAKSPQQIIHNTTNLHITNNELEIIRDVWRTHHKSILP